MVALAIFTWVTRDKADSEKEFMNMNQSASWIMIAGTYTATLISAVGMVGLPGQSYSIGWLYGIANWGSTVGLLLSALFFGPAIRRFGKTTMSEFFQHRFDSENFRFLTACVVVLGTGAYFVSQTIGAAVILETILGIPYNATVVIVILLVIYLALVGGAKTVTITDTIMFVIIAIGLGMIFCPLIVARAGFENIAAYARDNPDFFKAGGLVKAPLGTILGFMSLWAFGIGANPVNLSRAFLAKSNRHWIKGMMLGFCVAMLLIWAAHSAGGAIRIINPDIKNGSAALPWAALNAVPLIIGLGGILGLAAACVSTADTQLLVTAQSFVLDIFGHFKKDMTAKEAMKYTRIMLVVLGLLGLWLTLGRPHFVVAFGNFGASVYAAAFFPIISIAFFKQFVTKPAAYAAMTTGIVCDFVLHVIPVFNGKAWGTVSYLPYGIHPVLWSTVLAYVVLVVVSMATKPTQPEILAFETAMKNREPIDTSISDGNLKTCAYLLIAFGFALFGYILFLAKLTSGV